MPFGLPAFGPLPPKSHTAHGDHENADGTQTMTHADRTAFLIGACEWGDLEALQRLLELGETSFSAVGARTCCFPSFRGTSGVL